eukprot:scaffold94116_cov60-Phaeocystis_antarctica.AAC.2
MTEEQKGSEVLITYVHPTLVSEYRRFGYGGLPLQGFEKLRVTGIKVRLTLTLTLALTLTLRLHRHRSPLTAHLSPLTFHPHPNQGARLGSRSTSQSATPRGARLGLEARRLEARAEVGGQVRRAQAEMGGDQAAVAEASRVLGQEPEGRQVHRGGAGGRSQGGSQGAAGPGT